MEQLTDQARTNGGDRVSPAARKLTAEREAQILELRLRHVPFDQIGKALGISKQAANKGYYRALHRLPNKLAKDVVAEQLEELDRLAAEYWRVISSEEAKARPLLKWLAGDRILRAQIRRATLLGLDAPEKIDLRTLETAETGDLTARARQEMLARLTPGQRVQLLDLMTRMRGGEGGGNTEAAELVTFTDDVAGEDGADS